MSEKGYKIRHKSEAHFVTFAVVQWIDVFSRKQYRDILVDSLNFCRENKGLQVHAWCIMSNHVHLIISAKKEDLSDILRDFKKFTSKQIISAIENNEHESRREWMLDLFRKNAAQVSYNKNYQFWRQDNQPKECFGPAFAVQKLNYIHNNPVAAGIVSKAEDYVYTSAIDYHNQKKCGLIKISFLKSTLPAFCWQVIEAARKAALIEAFLEFSTAW
jgi:putative transposase